MKKLYEVKVERVTMDWGRFDGYDHIMWTTDKAKAEAAAEAERVRVEGIGAWWCGYGKADDGRPNVLVEMVGELVE